jgi:hypothetical protein
MMANPRKSSRFRIWIIVLGIALVATLTVARNFVVRQQQAVEVQVKGLQHLEEARSIAVVGTTRATLLPRLIALADN